MATHKFSVGDRVHLMVSKYAGDVPPGVLPRYRLWLSGGG